MVLLLVISCARVLRVSLGRESSDRGKLLYEFVMVALYEVCVLCWSVSVLRLL